VRRGFSLLAIGGLLFGTAAEAGARQPSERSCRAEIGSRAAQALATRCRFVSPATRPPCHPANSCALIRSEIARGCQYLLPDRPRECRGYTRPR
jgi:hypothetical protein